MKQYTFKIPFVEFWYCDKTFILWFFKYSWKSMFGYAVNGNVFLTVDNIDGKIKFKTSDSLD